MRQYVIGDIHGNYKGLVQAIERSPFNPQEDLLISLGDLVDGGSQSAEVVEYLSNIKNIILIRGNHDEVFENWLNTGVNTCNWTQGGNTTVISYIEFLNKLNGLEANITSKGDGYITSLLPSDIPEHHARFIKSAINYYIDDNRNCFVHGGFNRHFLLKEQLEYIFYWDRDLWMQALSYGHVAEDSPLNKFKIREDFNKIFIGHTSTNNWKTTKPMFAANIVNVDTGAGGRGKVTIMDTDTLEYWQSDTVEELYGQPFHR